VAYNASGTFRELHIVTIQNPKDTAPCLRAEAGRKLALAAVRALTAAWWAKQGR